MQLRRFPFQWVGLALALLGSLALVVFHEWAHDDAEVALVRIDTVARTRATLHRVAMDMLAMESASRNYLLSSDPKHMAQFDQAATAVETQLKTLHALALQDQGPRVEAVEQLDADLRRHLLQSQFLMQLQVRGDAPAWQALVGNEDGRRRLAAIQQQIEALYQEAGRQRQDNRQEIDTALGLSHTGIRLAMFLVAVAAVLYWRQLRARARSREEVETALRTERDRLDALVRERTTSLAALASHLQQVREDERGRLANELHDELGALLTAARLDVARLARRLAPATDDTSDLLDHLQRLLGEGIALKRRIIEDLRPSSLATLGLGPALEILAREFGERSGLDVASQVDAPLLDANTQLTVFRLVQESLTNVARHAHARRVDVVLRRLPGQLEVCVTDDGRGFQPQTPGVAHHGLAGMRHRVEAAGGLLEVISRPGRGTRIRATLPLPPEPAALAADEGADASGSALPLAAPPSAALAAFASVAAAATVAMDRPDLSVLAHKPAAALPTRSASTTV